MIGAMRHRLTLQQRVTTSDSAGGYADSWQNVAGEPVLYAAIEDLGGRVDFRGGQERHGVTHRLVIHYRADIRPDMRLAGDNKTYDIVAILDRDNRKAYLEVLALSGR